jgi:hypothetical protein
MARPLTEQETAILRAYQRQVNRLRGSNLGQSKNVAFSYSQTLSNLTGQVDSRYEGYEKDAFQAQLPILRQFLLQNDRVNFYRVHNLINQCCDRQELVDWTRYTLRRWKETLACAPIVDYFFLQSETQTVENAAQKLFHGPGGLFHANIHEPEEEENVRTTQEATLQSAFPQLFNCLHNLDRVIRLWLDEPNETVPPPSGEPGNE